MYSQQSEKDSIYILFNDENVEMQKVKYLAFKRKNNPDEQIDSSFTYYIQQKEPANGYDNKFIFSHANRDKQTYKTFGGTPPLKIIKDTSFLSTIQPLDIEFFRTTAYLKVCKTFEAEDSREQDVVIFMIDKDEIKDGKLVLREVKFSRPAKE